MMVDISRIARIVITITMTKTSHVRLHQVRGVGSSSAGAGDRGVRGTGGGRGGACGVLGFEGLGVRGGDCELGLWLEPVRFACLR